MKHLTKMLQLLLKVWCFNKFTRINLKKQKQKKPQRRRKLRVRFTISILYNPLTQWWPFDHGFHRRTRSSATTASTAGRRDRLRYRCTRFVFQFLGGRSARVWRGPTPRTIYYTHTRAREKTLFIIRIRLKTE